MLCRPQKGRRVRDTSALVYGRPERQLYKSGEQKQELRHASGFFFRGTFGQIQGKTRSEMKNILTRSDENSHLEYQVRRYLKFLRTSSFPRAQLAMLQKCCQACSAPSALNNPVESVFNNTVELRFWGQRMVLLMRSQGYLFFASPSCLSANFVCKFCEVYIPRLVRPAAYLPSVKDVYRTFELS